MNLSSLVFVLMCLPPFYGPQKALKALYLNMWTCSRYCVHVDNARDGCRDDCSCSCFKWMFMISILLSSPFSYLPDVTVFADRNSGKVTVVTDVIILHLAFSTSLFISVRSSWCLTAYRIIADLLANYTFYRDYLNVGLLVSRFCI